MLKNSRVAVLLPVIAFLFILLPSLVQRGMFLDGVTYAAISNNLASGLGEFWKPYYSATLYPEFYEHPPLVFGIQSLFFRLLGNSYLTEGIYCLFTAVLTALIIALLWKRITKGSPSEKLWWFPVLFWLVTPVVSWSYRNNMLENTLSFLCLLTVYFIWLFLENKRWYWLIPAVLLLDLSFLSKGPVGLFPLVLPFFFHLFQPRTDWKKAIVQPVIILVSACLAIWVYSLFDKGILQNLNSYFSHQLLPSLEGKREVTSSNRFMILIFAIREVLPIVVICLLLIFLRRKKSDEKNPNSRNALLMILLGLSAILPLMITLKQRSYYLVPAMPFLVSGCCLYATVNLHALLEKIRLPVWKWIFASAIFLMLAGVFFTVLKFGDYRRDEALLKDLKVLKENTAAGTIFSSHSELAVNWQLQAYLARFNNQCIEENSVHDYYLTEKGRMPEVPVQEEYSRVEISLSGFDLYRRKE